MNEDELLWSTTMPDISTDTAWREDEAVCMWQSQTPFMTDQIADQISLKSYFESADACGRYEETGERASLPGEPCRRLDGWEEDALCLEELDTIATFTAGPMEARRVLNNLPAPQSLSLEELDDPADRVAPMSSTPQAWNRKGQRNPFSIWSRGW